MHVKFSRSKYFSAVSDRSTLKFQCDNVIFGIIICHLYTVFPMHSLTFHTYAVYSCFKLLPIITILAAVAPP
jgi:hypothetical protein